MPPLAHGTSDGQKTMGVIAYTDTDHAPWTVVKSNDKKRARVNALHTLDYADKDTTRIGDTDPLIVGPAATVYETGENPDRAFPSL